MSKLSKRNPRAMALKVLLRWETQRPLLDEILSKVLEKSVFSQTRDQALVNELINGVVRNLTLIDYYLSRISKTPLKKMDPEVRNALRLGAYQIIFTRIPGPVAVNETIKVLKHRRATWIKGLINAILRNLEEKKEHIELPPQEMDPVDHLSIKYSYPRWMVERWIKRFGLSETEKLLQAGNQKPPLVVRTNTLRVSRQQLLTYLQSEIPQAQKTRFSPEGIILSGYQGNINKLRAFRVGWLQVQDEASQLVSHLLAPRWGEKILDACAGVGGKTTHIAQLLKNTGQIYALDIYPWRLKRLKENAQRLGITNIEVISMDATEALKRLKVALFDRILIDAPCTGTGIIRRHPDIKWARTPKDLEKIPAKQLKLLQSLAPLLKKGGILVYATCSLEKEENQEVIKNFLEEHKDFVIEKLPPSLKTFPELFTEEGFLQTYPHIHGLDGFFAVRIKKI